MKGRCSRQSPEDHDTAHCALGSMYASVAVTVRLLGYNVPRPSEFAPCNPAQLDSMHFWLFEGRVGARAGGSARCRTVGDLGSRVKRAVSGVVPADRDRVPHASAPRPQLGPWHQLSRMQLARAENKNTVKFKAFHRGRGRSNGADENRTALRAGQRSAAVHPLVVASGRSLW